MTQVSAKFTNGLSYGLRFVTNERYAKVYWQSPHPRKGTIVGASSDPKTVRVMFDDLTAWQYLHRNFFEVGDAADR